LFNSQLVTLVQWQYSEITIKCVVVDANHVRSVALSNHFICSILSFILLTINNTVKQWHSFRARG